MTNKQLLQLKRRYMAEGYKMAKKNLLKEFVTTQEQRDKRESLEAERDELADKIYDDLWRLTKDWKYIESQLEYLNHKELKVIDKAIDLLYMKH